MLARNQDENIQFDQSMGHTGTCKKTKNTEHKKEPRILISKQ
jgi:hypothetical protein